MRPGLRRRQEGQRFQAVALPRGRPFAGHRQGDLHDRPMGARSQAEDRRAMVDDG